MPKLILIKSPGGMTSPQAYPLDFDSLGNVVIGRQKDKCQIVIDDGKQTVSRMHTVLMAKQGDFFVENVGRNNTLLNNRIVERMTMIKHDDRLKICDFLFRFEDERGVPAQPLPSELLRSLPDPLENDPENSTIQHTVTRNAAQEFLEAQPAERLRALLDISSSLARTLELDPLLPQIAETLFDVFRQADRCFVIQLTPERKPYAKFVKSRRRNASEGFSQTIVNKCLSNMKSFLSEDASSDQELGAAQSLAEFRIRSVMCVPLATTEGIALGALQLDTQDPLKKFHEDDLKLLTIVANFASVAIEKAQVHATLLQREKSQREIEIAKEVQLGFLPQHQPQVLGYQFYEHYSAAQTIGGDYYDYIILPDNKVAIILGDVAGKGVPAALLMAKLSAEVRFCILTQPDLAQAISLLNNHLVNGGIGDRFVTLIALLLDPNMNRISIVNAGHLTPQIYCPESNILKDAISEEKGGLPLGIAPDMEYEIETITLEEGQSLTIFTDGVTDATNTEGITFEMPGVLASIHNQNFISGEPTPMEIGQRIVKAVKVHTGSRPQADDIALVTFGRMQLPISTMPKIDNP